MVNTAYRTASSTNAPPAFPDLLRGWRKTRKISQWDLSLNAGVSQRHLSFLESGRSAPSRDMVLLLARSLELPLREQNALLTAAGFAHVYRESEIGQKEMAQANHALQVMLKHHEPYPALVIDRNWNLLMSNEANTKLFSVFVDAIDVWERVGPGEKPNLIRLTLHEQGLRPYIRNWKEFSLYFIRSLKLELNSNPYNAGASRLLNEILGYPGITDTDLIATDSITPYLSLEMVRQDVELKLFSMVSTFGTPHDVTLQELRIETFFPADEITEGHIRRICGSR